MRENINIMKFRFIILLLLLSTLPVLSQETVAVRERLSMDAGWRFSLGHATNTAKDFNHATGYFSYFAKTGYGDGPAAGKFDDRAWRVVDLPHDWAVELPFTNKGSHSHGFNAIGRAFPENSIGWYRKHFFIPKEDLGRRIVVEFDGVHRNSSVFINGFYVGQKHSGYSSFQYDITDYLNYGGNNVVAVRADATMEEGWFYEGAGIYRHVWLTKTAPLHVAQYGNFVTTDIKKDAKATVIIQTTVVNESTAEAVFEIEQTVLDASGKSVASAIVKQLTLKPLTSGEYSCNMNIAEPKIWSLENPYMHKVVTKIRTGGKEVDSYETPFGIRTVRFDPNEGFFLNGKHIKLKGVNQHQDHAGVGTAIPDALQEFRILRLKEMGCNAIRTSHNPPTPGFLDACDRLGMLVLAENRLMGSNQEHFEELKSFIYRDRNHPSVIIWSLGNEEWAIEGNITGARIASTMQNYAQQLDPSRRFTTAISGGWGAGISTVIDVMGFNYLTHGNIDDHHKKYPQQPAIGTEETTTSATRGVYFDDLPNCHLAPTDRKPGGSNIEKGWKYYDERPFLSGLFFWTGFDYRGEPTPFTWPAVTSQFGIVDVCGFPKDQFYYLKSWWTQAPVLHLAPHWNWQGKEGQEISVWVYSNCDEVELFLNKKSLGRKAMPKNGHLEWLVKYQPGTLAARGFKNGKEICKEQIETTGQPASVKLIPDKATIKADGQDVSVITIQVADSKGRIVPTANNEISFTLTGPAKIIGVGNGNPSSHEPDKYLEEVNVILIDDLKALRINSAENRPETGADFDVSNWKRLNVALERDASADSFMVIRGTFDIKTLTDETQATLFPKGLGEIQAIYINGKLIASDVKRYTQNLEYKLAKSILKAGKNVYAIVGTPLKRNDKWEILNIDPGVVQVKNPAGVWKRKLFNGSAQVIIQSAQQPGEVVLKAISPGLTEGTLKITTQPVTLHPFVPAE